LPVQASREIDAVLESNSPIVVVASAHFGPLFFDLLVVARLLRKRHIVLRQEADYLRRLLRYLRHFGFEIMFDTPHSIRALVRTFQAPPGSAVMSMFDHT